jgi:hypothetical protein
MAVLFWMFYNLNGMSLLRSRRLYALPGVTLKCVKGHQDCNNDDYQQLSLMAQLYVLLC